MIQHDWHVGGWITLSVGSASEGARGWGINGYGRMVRLPEGYDEPEDVGMKLVTYRIVVFTARAKGAGTDAKVFIHLTGEKIGHRTERITFTKDMLVEPKRRIFEPGGIDMFEFEAEDVGELLKIKIGHDNTCSPTQALVGGAAWLLDRVTVENTRTGIQWTLAAGGENGQWFDEKKGDGKFVRDLVTIRERLDKNHVESADEEEEDVAGVTFGEGEQMEHVVELPAPEKRGVLSRLFGRGKKKAKRGSDSDSDESGTDEEGGSGSGSEADD
jgi:hypothetical protein